MKITVRQAERASARGRVYVFGVDCCTRQGIASARAVARQGLRELDASGRLFGVDPETVELEWSRTAGCSCGCSPGFKLPQPVLATDDPGVHFEYSELFFTVEN